MLDVLVRSRVMARLLTYFMQHAEKEVYLRELARDVDEPASAVQRELERLIDFGFVSVRKHGVHKYVGVNLDFPLLPEFQAIYRKTEGAVAHMQARLAELDGVQLAFAYGPFAEQQSLAQSDIDIMLIGTTSQEALDTLLNEMGKALGRTIRCTHYQPDEFGALLEARDEALERILNGEKVVLVANIAEKVPD